MVSDAFVYHTQTTSLCDCNSFLISALKSDLQRAPSPLINVPTAWPFESPLSGGGDHVQSSRGIGMICVHGRRGRKMARRRRYICAGVGQAGSTRVAASFVVGVCRCRFISLEWPRITANGSGCWRAIFPGLSNQTTQGG